MSEITTISNSRMTEFCNTIVRQTREALLEREQDILDAWHENINEANENDKKFPPLKLNISATVDLEGNAIETAVSFTVKYTSTIREMLPDPNQPELPGVGSPISNLAGTLAPGESMEVTANGEGIKIEHGGKIMPIRRGKKSQPAGTGK